MLLVTPSNVTGILKKKHDQTQIEPPKAVRFISDHMIDIVDNIDGDEIKTDVDQTQLHENMIDPEDMNTHKMSRAQDIIYGILMTIAIIGGISVAYYFVRKCSNKAVNSIDTQRRNCMISEPEII